MNSFFASDAPAVQAGELEKYAEMWQQETGKSSFPDEIHMCGEILKRYAAVLRQISDSVYENERNLISAAEEIF